MPDGIQEFRNGYLHLVIDEATRLLYSEWVRKPTSAEYREAAKIFADHLRGKTIEYWIQDTNHLGEVPIADVEIVLQELIPVGVSAGLKRVARISSDEQHMAALMSLANKYKAKLNIGIELEQFKTYREAAEWIWDSIIK